MRAESITNGLEPSLSEQFAAAVEREEADLRAPLLQDSGRLDLEKAYGDSEDRDADSGLQTKEIELPDDEEEHVQGSSFLQALFNGMNILAGNVKSAFTIQRGRGFVHCTSERGAFPYNNLET